MRIFTLLTLLSAVFIANPVSAKETVKGLWLTQNERSVIEIKDCKTGVCGYIYWIIEGGMQFDAKNPDETLRGEPMCGLPILWGFEQDAPGEWSGGKIYKADDGDIYNANIELQDDGTLRVRGYVGAPLFGKTQIWNPVSADDYKVCMLPKE